MTLPVFVVGGSMNGPIPHFDRKLAVLLSNRDGRPVLHGDVAAWVGCSLEAAERQLEHHLETGRLRRLTTAELRAEGWREDVIAYRRTTASLSPLRGSLVGPCGSLVG